MACLSDSLVATFTEGRANADQIATVEAHLADCAPCRQLIAQVAALDAEPPSNERTRLRTSDGQTLADGTVLADRYRILRFISKGGMGEVYAAEDLELGEIIALKVPTLGDLLPEERWNRLKREVQLARRIAHANVCRIFDVGVHRAAGGRDVVFLTMELLDGETLSAELARRGPLAPGEAAALVEQLAAGLAAAHACGVVHRDFKSDNVILVPAREETRAVIIDFGLARDDAGAGTAVGALVGTLQYLAPEQLEGQRATAATDVHALGVVWFEMLTGRPPFVGATAQEAGLRRLREEAPRARSLVPVLSPAHDAAIARCLARRPGDRFAEVAAVVPALRGRGRMARRLLLAATAALVAALLVAGVIAVGLRARPPAAMRPRPSLAVVEAGALANADERAWAEAALAELVRTRLAASGELRVADGATEAVGGATSLPELARRLRADRLVVVAATKPVALADKFQVEVTQWSADGKRTTLAEAALSAGELPALARTLATQLGAPRGDESAGPDTPEALRLYGEGLQRARLADDAGAVERWQRARQRERASDPWLLAQLAAALDRLGYAPAAATTRAAAVTAAPPSLRRRLDADSARAARQWDRLVAVGRAALALHADDAAAALAVAEGQAHGGDCAGARATLAALPDALLGAPDRELAEARRALVCGEWEPAVRAADAAAAQARADGNAALTSDARRLAGAALLAAGMPAPARTAAAEALTLATAARDPLRAVDALLTGALAAVAAGTPSQAEAALEDAAARAHRLDALEREARALLDLAALARQQEHPDAAARWLARWSALATRRQNDPPNQGATSAPTSTNVAGED